MKNFFIGVFLCVAIGLTGVVLMDQKPAEQPLGNIATGGPQSIYSVTNSSTSVATSSTATLSANEKRVYARITNNSANEIWCSETSGAAVVNQGLSIPPVSSSTLPYIEFGLGDIPSTGRIACIAETAASAVSTYEGSSY